VTFREGEAVGGLLGADVDGSGAAADMGDETGRWLDDAGCSNGHEDRAFAERAKNFIEVEGHFAEPADVRTNPAAAFAPGNLGGRVERVRVIEGRAAASVAAALEKLAVHVNNTARTGLLVEAVHVLRAEKQAILQVAFELGECEVAPGFGLAAAAASRRIE